MRRHAIPLVLALSLALPASASGLPAPASRGAGALARVAAVREGLASGGVLAALRAAAALQGTSVATPAIVDGPSAVAALADAVAQAGRIVEDAVPVGARLDAVTRAARRTRSGDLALRRGGVDRARLLAAGALVSAAVDRALPALQAWARTASGGGSVACDQIDQPNVCVGGPGNNTYTADKALQIDLGGDDVFANSAGGADRAGNGLPVSVSIDLGGNDRYETNLPTASGGSVAQGSAVGGVGILVDVEGDDSYAATSTTAATAGRAQAFAGLGVGILVDQDGADRYRVTFAPTAPSTLRAQGMAFAGVGGTAVLLDRAGADEYLLESAPTPSVNGTGQVVSGAALAQGLGYAEAGAALVHDGEGGDRFTLQALSDKVAPDETRDVVTTSATAEGLAFSTLGGAAVVTAATGPTTWTARAIARSPATGNASVSGLGASSSGGFAALSDAGGADVYTAEARSLARRERRADDACGCVGATAETAAGSSLTRAGGVGASAIGLLHDGGGADRYTSVATSRAEAVARDERTTVPPNDPGVGAGAISATGTSVTTSFGFGAVGGEGLLLDEGGDDAYDIGASSDAIATATTAIEGMRRVGSATAAAAAVRGEAAATTGGFGELRDAGGADRYDANARSSAIADPATEAYPDVVISSVQGSSEAQPVQGVTDQIGAGALLVELDNGLVDIFAATPADPPCSGTRGQGLWRDCGAGAGGGFGA